MSQVNWKSPYTELIDKVPVIGKLINDYILGRNSEEQMTGVLAPAQVSLIKTNQFPRGIKVGKNSLRQELESLINGSSSGEVRGIKTGKDSYVWDANQMIHDPMAEKLGVDVYDPFFLNKKSLETTSIQDMIDNAITKYSDDTLDLSGSRHRVNKNVPVYDLPEETGSLEDLILNAVKGRK